MSLKKIEKIEHHFRRKSRSHKKDKKQRNRWLRRTPKDKIPPTKQYFGWEY